HQLAPLPEGVGRLVEALEFEQQVAALLEVARDRGGRGAGVDRLLRVAERLGAALLVAAPEQRLGEVEQDQRPLAAEPARRALRRLLGLAQRVLGGHEAAGARGEAAEPLPPLREERRIVGLPPGPAPPGPGGRPA